MTAPIAIVGRGCVLPGALDPASLSRLVMEGASAIGPAPDDRWRLSKERALTSDPKHAVDRAWSDAGGYVRGFDGVFDPSGFALDARAVASLDPIFRWTLHASREALREAGGAAARSGVVLGNLSFPTASHAALVERHWLAPLVDRPAVDPRERFHSSLVASLAAGALSLKGGPSFCLDAACASSLYAIALACDALADGRADLMLAGAVNCTDDLFIHVGFCALDALSKTGRSRPFHPEADGLVPAEGAAVLALMRLDDAVRERRPVLGVIRGIGLANDGRARGFLAPSEEGQARAMRAAYARAGLAPSDVGWIECHATGTPLGDATEVRSTASVFAGCRDVPIGSLKANLGHLITTAGAAGLLKVLGAFEAGLRPPTPHLDRVADALSGTPLRVVREPEPWDQRVRRAAISAFGFGGNDAHLIVEQHAEGRAYSFAARPIAPEPLAIVAIGARVGPLGSARAFADALATGAGGRRAAEVTLPLELLRTPPSDLERALAQQTMLLAAALDARVEGLDPDRTAVLVGMQCDPEVARYGVRWRLPELAPALDAGAFAPPLGAAGVLGTMPNIPANRLNRELDARGPSYTISAAELSGVRALEIAARALRAGELDAAVVGAVDLCAEPVHEAAARAALPPALARGGDAAIVLVVTRLDDARAQGRAVLAILDERVTDASLRLGPSVEGGSLAPRFGHAQAASGLLHVAAAALCLHRRARPGEAPGGWASERPRAAVVEVEAMDGARATIALREDEETPEGAPSLEAIVPKHALVLPAHPAPPRVARAVGGALLDPAPALPPASAAPCLARAAPADGIVELAPALPPVLAPSGEVAPSTGRSSEHVLTAGMGRSERALTAAGRSELALAPAGVAGTSEHVLTQAGAAGRGDDVLAGARAPASPRSRALLEAVAAQHAQLAALHDEFVRTQTELHERFLAARESALAALRGAPARDREATPGALAPPRGGTPRGAPSTVAPERGSRSEQSKDAAPQGPSTSASLRAPFAPSTGSGGRREGTSEGDASASRAPASLRDATSAARGRGLAPATPPPAPHGRTFSRAELEVHASGRISTLFGERFAPQDAHAVQVRMPEPPLLLADRVTGLAGEAGSMGKGSVWTETDVRADAWYLANGRMPAGLMIESGQADLFLISWLGADLLNRGERAYRLLGCTLTWHRSPPAVGETLSYDIHVDGHATQGDVRLFFFHYDCHVGGRPALTVRSGQAGFFTKEELAASAGVIWTPADQEIPPGARLDPPAARSARSSFETEDLEALSRGEAAACFGPAWEPTRAHVRTPTIAGGEMRFLERVTDFDPAGGVHGRGYLRAVTRISPDDWYFRGHFKNDPCMPGTLMLEGCLSAMAFYLIGLGYTLDRDGWRFEPIPDETYSMICRGQVIPTSRELTYEVFVEEVHDGPIPKLYADLLCTVDGLKAFHARRMGIQLVPDWPLTSLPSGLPGAGDPEPVATLDGLPLGRAALLASGWGKPSTAFGPRYAEFDAIRRAPRLPGPPYDMVHRITRVEGEPWSKKSGAVVEAAYDVPAVDAWYFADGQSGHVPYALLLEAALQPCGWLATFSGSTLGRSEDLRFRNLDGEGEVLAEIPPGAGTLRTRATLTSMSDTASMVIVGFDVTSALGEIDVYRLKTVFGFFPDAAFRDQAGLPATAAHRALLEARGGGLELGPMLPEGRLALLDRVPYFDPSGGRARLGAARAETDVDAGAWFFRAHFFQDPVQPGSLGIEAMLSLLRAAMLAKGLHREMRAPRFRPVALGRAHRWKYRGQVLPSDRRVAVTLEITAIEASEGRVLAEADASFWIDAKRIYEATVAVELVDDAESASRRSLPLPLAGHSTSGRAVGRAAPWPANGQLDLDAVARFWRDELGVGRPWLAEDLYLALLARFVSGVHVDDAARAALRHGPALYLASHQTAIETLMFSVAMGALSGVPLVTLAKREHRTSWLGALLAWIFAHPDVREPELTAYFDREEPASLPALLSSLPQRRSILVHAEGTRARSCREPVARVGSAPIELAIARALPIVPVRFAGGLPVEPAAEKLDFPHAMGAQAIHVGPPISAEELRALPSKARLDRARDAIEALGPPRAEEAPSPGDLVFAAEVARHASDHGVELAHAVFACALRERAEPCELTRRLLAREPLGDGPDARWAESLAARLFGR